eukprot:tig00000179_g13068.t1
MPVGRARVLLFHWGAVPGPAPAEPAEPSARVHVRPASEIRFLRAIRVRPAARAGELDPSRNVRAAARTGVGRRARQHEAPPPDLSIRVGLEEQARFPPVGGGRHASSIRGAADRVSSLALVAAQSRGNSILVLDLEATAPAPPNNSNRSPTAGSSPRSVAA